MINRRDFLRSVIATGIAVALPIPLSQANDHEVNAAWETLSKNTSCTLFTVDEYRTITCPWEDYPSYRHEIFEVKTEVRSRQALLRAIDACPHLAEHFYLEFDTAVYEGNPLAVRLNRQDKDWSDWVLKGSLKEHQERIEAWLADSIGDEEMPLSAGPVGAAYLYFDAQDYSTLDRLGVVIIAGEHPGSSYFAAELRVPIEQANVSAEAHDIPIRFISA